MEKYKNEIKKYRNLKGLTQKDLAEKLHVEHTTISNYERGVRKVDIETFARIAHILDVTVKELTNVEVDISSNYGDPSEIRKNFTVKSFKNEINNKYVVFEIVSLLVFFVVFLIPSFITVVSFLIFFFIVLLLIIINIFRLFVPVRSVVNLSIEQDKNIVFESEYNRSFKKFSLWIASVVFVYFSLLLVSSLVYTGLDIIGKEENLDMIFTIFILLILFNGISVIYFEITKWKTKKEFDYEKFLYKYNVFLFRLTIVFSELLYLVTYMAIYIYREELNTQLYWIYLFYSPLLILSSYELFSRKLEHLSSFEYKIID